MIKGTTLKKDKFRRNDIVKCIGSEFYHVHNRLMVIEGYYDKSKIIAPMSYNKGRYLVVTEGGNYREKDLELVFRKNK